VPQIPGTNTIVFNPLLPRSSRFATFALEAANRNHSANPKLTKMICWNSVVEAARLSGSISDAAAAAITKATTREYWSPFVPFDTETALSLDQFLNIPIGSFIAFLATPYGGEPNPEQGLVLAHAMVYLGAGRAAGSNNGVIGGEGGWSVMDLNTLPWKTTPGNFFFTREKRNFIVRYRNIEDTQRKDCIIM
jgi:hypothetical protein